MSEDIYLVGQDGALIEMSAAAYDSEDLLQCLLATYPAVLAGAQIDRDNSRRWILDPGPLRPIKWHRLAVHGEEVLPEENADMLQEVAQPADHRDVAADGVAGLGDIDNVEDAHDCCSAATPWPGEFDDRPLSP